jgi:dipeptidyl aminopeptidase/acylaminoacyl peptidase
VLDVASGELTPASSPDLNVWEASWCGGDAVVAIVSAGAGEGAWYGAELALVDPVAGSARTLRHSDVQLGWVAGSPDGAHVAVVEAVCGDRMIVAGNCCWSSRLGRDPHRRHPRRRVVDGVARRRAPVRDRPARPRACGARRASHRCRGFRDLGRIGILRREPLPVRLAVGPGQRSRRRRAWVAPSVVVADGESALVLADFAHEGSTARREMLGDRRRVRWSAPDGLEIEGFLTLPRGRPPFATILHVHGGPIWAFQDTPPRDGTLALIEHGYAIFDPNVRGSAGYGRAFASRVVGDMGGDDAGDMLSGLDQLVADGLADGDRIGIMGQSYGGFMACWLPTQDARFKAAAALSPVTNWYSERFGSNLGAWVGDFLDGEPKASGGQYYDRSPVCSLAPTARPHC